MSVRAVFNRGFGVAAKKAPHSQPVAAQCLVRQGAFSAYEPGGAPPLGHFVGHTWKSSITTPNVLFL